IFLTVFHSAFILFILIGWRLRQTRQIHMSALLLTLIAWLLLGLYKGVIGYCPLTDWHWDVKRALGETGMPASFVEYMVEKAMGINFPTLMIDIFTASGLIFGIAMSMIIYTKESKKSAGKVGTLPNNSEF
ncbi:MAG: DUF2784 domain-containing protein, partial [Marinoscillum sp.]